MKFFLSICLTFTMIFSMDYSDFENEFSQSEQSNRDFLLPYNVMMTNFNDFIYINLLEPTSKAYSNVVPKKPRKAISNFFYNLGFPVRFINNLLQFKLENSADEVFRFFFNSTIGVAGFFDVASDVFNMKKHDEDLGQTLGRYGVGDNFYIVWPFLGPSNLRDSFGLMGDYFANPISYVNPFYFSASIKTYDKINEFSFVPNQYSKAKQDSVNLYLFLKDAYEQNRRSKIKE